MKTLFSKLCYGFTILITMVACGKDNYDAPESQLSGQVIHNGTSIGVRGSNQSVRLQLWQDGYSFKSPIDVYVTQDGSFSAQLFDGTYKLTTVSGNGPWLNSQDTVLVNVKGSTTVNYEVEPYYTLENVQYTREGNTLKASFTINTINTTRTIENAILMVNDTQFIDLGQHAKKVENLPTGAQVTLELDVTDNLSTNKALFARVGLKITGLTEAIYDTSIEQIN